MKVNITKRKTQVRIDNSDCWSLDHTLAKIIYPALLHLKEIKQGIPNDIADVGGENFVDQDCFDFYEESHSEAFNRSCEKWDEILDKMIWSFQQLTLEDYSQQYHHGKPEYEFVETEKLYNNPITGKLERTYSMVDKNPSEHWYDSVGHQLHEERIQEGLDLFAKYYRSLWD